MAVAIFVILVICALTLIRVKIPRDPAKEGKDTLAALKDYNNIVSRWILFDFFRFLEINRLKKYRPHGTLVDAGCGPGFVDLALARKYPQLDITGVDISKDTVDLAKKNQASMKLERQVSFEVGDVEGFSLADNSINFIISSLSLHHWSNADKAMKEIFRVLKPGGRFLIFDLRRDQPLLIYYGGQLIQKFFSPNSIKQVNGGLGSIWSSYTPREMQSLLRSSPFHQWSIKKGWAWAFMEGQK